MPPISVNVPRMSDEFMESAEFRFKLECWVKLGSRNGIGSTTAGINERVFPRNVSMELTPFVFIFLFIFISSELRDSKRLRQKTPPGFASPERASRWFLTPFSCYCLEGGSIVHVHFCTQRASTNVYSSLEVLSPFLPRNYCGCVVSYAARGMPAWLQR